MANLTACAGIANRPPRAARSSYECMQAVLKEMLPPDLPDKRAHCLAGGLISRYCSITDAYLAAAGKEVRDLLSQGDAEWLISVAYTEGRRNRISAISQRIQKIL